jgi:bifunctional non-homologous end joining protein LigD
VWAFDLLHYNGRDLRELPLLERKLRLKRLIMAANTGWLHYSESLRLLAEADSLGLAGVVSKRREPSPVFMKSALQAAPPAS